MAFYSKDEIEAILNKLSQQTLPNETNTKSDFKKLGIIVDETKFVNLSENQFVCSECKKILMTSHLLDLHLAENHDTFFELQKLKKPMFACFLAQCKQMSMNVDERRDHCIKDHKFPHDFRFDSNFHHISKNKSTSDSMEVDDNPAKGSKAKNTNFTNFHFGHRGQKTFNRSTKKSMNEVMNSMVTDLRDSLPE